MAFKLYENTWETSTTTGTGSYTLAGAVSGWRAFSAQYANNDTCYYSAYDGTNFEVGVGTFVSATPALARTTIYRSSNGGAAVNWGVGTRSIVVAPLGIALDSLLTLGSTGIPNRTADNTWAYLPYATGSWTPVDSSGAALTFTTVSANYTRIGNIVHAYGQLTYPATASGLGAVIGGLPFTIANQDYAQQGMLILSSLANATYILPVKNTTTIQVYNSTASQQTNANLTGVFLVFQAMYPIA